MKNSKLQVVPCQLKLGKQKLSCDFFFPVQQFAGKVQESVLLVSLV